MAFIIRLYQGYGTNDSPINRLKSIRITNYYQVPSPWLTESGQVSYPGNVGIGTTSPDAELTVKGEIHAEMVNVDLNVPGPDYVFEEDYPLRSLEDTEAYIKAHKHLPEIPSAKEMEAQGIDLAQMNMLLLKKIEELTLHQIDLLKKIEDQHKRIQSLENQ